MLRSLTYLWLYDAVDFYSDISVNYLAQILAQAPKLKYVNIDEQLGDRKIEVEVNSENTI